MHPAFATIQFGPFETEYHRQAVNDEFREALSAYLEKELLPQVDEPFERTDGTLTAVFNEEKYCGPRSAVKDTYALEFSFFRSAGADSLKVQIMRDAKTREFRPRYAGQPLFLWTAKRKQKQSNFRQAIDGMVQRILKGEKDTWRCPRCNQELSLIDTEHLFDLSCPGRCFNFNFHRDPATREFMHGHFFSKPQ